MEIARKREQTFSDWLLRWHSNENRRDLPWKGEQDPYKIWLSEILLQQTRAAQAMPYYYNFISAYPTVQMLAAAADDDVFRLWQGLGYYSRCANMLTTARMVVNEPDGKFPNTYEGLLKLKGVGVYTAAAIASFAYGLPHAVVDGNVYRILSRYFGEATPCDTTAGKKLFSELANEVLAKKDSAAHNQAMMDLGASVCTPQKPACDSCPLLNGCYAAKQGIVAMLPVKSKKVKVRTRYFNYFVLTYRGEVWIRKRGEGDIWKNLHEPLLVETAGETTLNELANKAELSDIKKYLPTSDAGVSFSQQLTHQRIRSTFYCLELPQRMTITDSSGKWMSRNELNKLAFPKTVVSFFEKLSYF